MCFLLKYESEEFFRKIVFNIRKNVTFLCFIINYNSQSGLYSKIVLEQGKENSRGIMY